MHGNRQAVGRKSGICQSLLTQRSKPKVMKMNRNQFMKAGGGLAAAAVFSGSMLQSKNTMAAPAKLDMPLGLASYSFRKFSLEQTIEMVKTLGITHLALKSMHMPLDATEANIKAAAKKVRDAGLNLYGAGVIYMKNEDEVHQAFDYARAADLRVIIGVPQHELLPLVDKKVKEYNIKVAIHNHGPGDDLYPSPESIYEKVKGFDKRIGICMDIGHTRRIGLDPASDAKKYADRLHDVHIKDVSAAKPEGETVEIGRGVIDIPAFLKTLDKIKYDGVVSLEYEKDANAPMVGSAESIGYLKGVMRMM